jgi:hypothetical protein
MNRLDCSASSGFIGLRGINHSPFLKGNLSWRGSSRQCHCRLRWRPYRSFLAPIEQSCFVSQAATLCALQGNRRAVSVIDAKPLASAVAEIKFEQIAMQVRFADVLIHAVNAALQDREKAFNRVSGDDAVTLAAHVFVFAMGDGLVRSKIPADLLERTRFVGHESAFRRRKIVQCRANIVSGYIGHVDRTRGTAALNQGQDGVHVPAAATLGLSESLAANVGHVRFNGLAFTPKRRSVVTGFQNLADAMGEKPSGLHAAIKGSLYLASANALLAASDKLDGLKPQMQREVAVLENAADPHGKGFAAGIALVEAGAAGLAGQTANALAIAIAAMRTNRPIRPQVSLDIGESGFLIVKMGGG